MNRTQVAATTSLSQTRPSSASELTFLEHLYELRGRLIKVAIALIAGALLGYTFHGHIISFLLVPLGGEKLVYLTPGGGFDFIFKVSLYIGFALALPVAVYQLYRYLAPLMYRRQNRRLTAIIILTSCALAISGMLFGYFVALPAALHFLTGFAGEYIEASLTASSYLNFITAYSIGLAALFQLPIILLFINMINGPLKPSTLFTSQRYVVLGALVLAAIITPTPDVVNQAIVAGPVLLVYQLGVGMVLVQNSRRTKTVRSAPTTPEAIPFIAPRLEALQPPVKTQTVAPKTAPQQRPVMDVMAAPRGVRQTGPRIPQRPVERPVRPVMRSGIASIDGIVTLRKSPDIL